MKRAVLLALAAVLPSAVAVAAPKELGQLKGKDVVTAQPGVGFVMLHTRWAVPLKLIREPDEADRQDWARRRAEALAKAHAKYERKLRQYESAIANPIPGNTSAFKPEKPIEPTDENFAFTPIETELMVTIDSGPAFQKSDSTRVYVKPLAAGTYAIYGHISTLSNGTEGACLCMGTVKFTVTEGKITDLGEITIDQTGGDTGPEFWDEVKKQLGGLKIANEVPTAVATERLGNLPVVPADYAPAGKFANFFGIYINRLAEMPGVFSYDRDKQVDQRGSSGNRAP